MAHTDCKAAEAHVDSVTMTDASRADQPSQFRPDRLDCDRILASVGEVAYDWNIEISLSGAAT